MTRRPRPIKLTEADIARFWEKVDRRGPKECWEWQATRISNGYGRFRIGHFLYRAHRVAFVITNSDTKLQVCHYCNNPPCCNPKHLYAGTQKDNVQQCIAEGRFTRGDNCGEKQGHAKLTEADVREIRRLYAGGWLQRVIAKEYGINQTAVSKICTGRNWKHI